MNSTTRLHRLTCGMPLLIFESHEAPVATADIWVRTGAADEPPAVGGISHFLEHMLFKGTARYGVGEIERIIENHGGLCNAGTSFDFTHYYITLPAKDIGTAITMLAEMTRHSTLDAEELEKERLVILEEYRRKQDHPTGVLFERLYAELFETGPYHETVIGTEQTIKDITREAMFDYYAKRYAPDSMALVVTGDVEPRAVIEQAEQAYREFGRPLMRLAEEPPTQYGAAKRVHLTKPTGGEMYVCFAFPATGLDRPDWIMPLDVAQYVLGQGRASILHQRIKEKAGLCSSIATYYPTHLRNSLFVVVATCRPDQIDALREALVAELEGFCRASADPRQVDRARRLLRSSHLFSQETSSGAATGIGYYYTLTGETAFHDHYLENLEEVTPESVTQATAETLGAGRIGKKMVEVSVGPELVTA